GPEIHRRPAEALQGHQTAQRLKDRIEARSVGVRTARAEGRDRGVDQARVYRAQPLVADAQALGDARPHVLHHDVGALGELPDDLAAFLGLQIHGERALATIPAQEAGQLAERIALERLDLDD